MRLTVASQTEDLDVQVDLSQGSTVGELVAALRETAQVDGERDRLWSDRKRTVLEPDLLVALVGLADGDRIELLSPEQARARMAPLVLRVIEGPDAGREWPLADGSYLIGRALGATTAPDVALADDFASRSHAQLDVQGASCVVRDLGSANGTLVDSSLIAGPTNVTAGSQIELGSSVLVIASRAEALTPIAAGMTTFLDTSGQIPFNRPPRLDAPFAPTIVSIDAPPLEPQQRHLPLLASLVPLAMGVGMALAFKLVQMLAFAVMSPVMAFASIYSDRRSGRKVFLARQAAFVEAVREGVATLRAARAAERAAALAASPAPLELVDRALKRASNLWERRLGDHDFLVLRLGTCEMSATSSWMIGPGGSEELRADATRLLELGDTLASVPATLALDELGVVGLSGGADRVASLARWLIAQVAILHSPAEVVIVAATADGSAWSWLDWLPHVQSDVVTGSGSRVVGDEQARALIGHLDRLIASRRGSEHQATAEPGATVFVLWDGALGVDRALLAGVLRARDQGIRVVWMDRDVTRMPGECRAIVDATSDRLDVRLVSGGNTYVQPDELSPTVTDTIARSLAPLRDAARGVTAAGIPEGVGLLEALGMSDVNGGRIVDRWRSTPTGIAAPLGMTASGPFMLDIQRDGPHMLVGGITASGKSELLQAMVASIAATHPPDRVSFLLVDYKGTAAFGAVEHLPHSVGMVTDLRPHLTTRALASLNAELRRREALLDEHSAKDLVELEVLAPDLCPARLVLVVDEFAALAKEVPEFVTGVVDIAQRGRSLGIHIVLATQRPADAINEKIRANVDLRIALRVADTDLSTQIIDSPAAARIKRETPGRAIARLGPGELVEFQTAYGGRRSPQTPSREIVVRQVGTVTSLPKLTGPTDLERVVEAIRAAAVATNWRLPARPWMPALEELIRLDDLDDPINDARPVIGVVDAPLRQYQGPWVLDLDAMGAIGVFGATRSGKTTLLRTVVCSLARAADPSELWLYGLDFASRGLDALGALPHVGSIIGGDEPERVHRLFATLRRTIEERRNVLAEAHASNLGEYRRLVGSSGIPRIVVLLDGLAAFLSTFERVDMGALTDALPRLVSDGGAVGVHFVIASERRPGGASALTNLMTQQILLRQADAADYGTMGVDVRGIDPSTVPPGRVHRGDGVEAQVACVGDDGSAASQAGAIAELAARLSALSEVRAPAIATLPTTVAETTLPPPSGAMEVVVGIGDELLEPVTLSLASRQMLVIGPNRSGRSSTLAAIAQSLARGTDRPELRLVSPRRSAHGALAVWDRVTQGDECAAVLAALADEVDSRPDDGTARWLVVFVDDANELDDVLKAAVAERVVRRGRDRNVRFVVATETRSAHRSFTGLVAELRRDKQGLLLQPEPEVDGELLGTRLPRRSRPIVLPGRGYLVSTDRVELVQGATPG